MNSEETQVWERWIDAEGDLWESVQYDVLIGEPSPIPEGADQQTIDMIEALSRSRIDAVLHRPDQICVVEVTPRIGLRAYGQIRAYQRLYIREHGEEPPVIACVIGASIRPDAQSLLEEDGILISIV